MHVQFLVLLLEQIKAHTYTHVPGKLTGALHSGATCRLAKL